jgi:hypothetical protein
MMSRPPSELTQAISVDLLVERLRRGKSDAGLGDGDVGALRGADAIFVEEDLVRRADSLADARKMRDAIVIALALLGKVDVLVPDEPDYTAFHEIADLFQEVIGFASFGASSARRAAERGNEW